MFLYITTCVLAIFSAGSEAANCEGCVPLDLLSFDKVLSKFTVSLVKFDVAYPYGDKHEEFAKVSKDAAEHPDLFVGEVGIKDYGDQENMALGQRFKLEKEDYPTVFLFVKNNQKGSIDEHRFPGEPFTAQHIKDFIKSKSGVYLPLPGCIVELDQLTEDFVGSSTKQQEAKVRAAEEIAKQLDGNSIKNAKIYIKLMRKVSAEGSGFLAKETKRINKILAGKLTPAKKTEMEERLNILASFKLENTKDEL